MPIYHNTTSRRYAVRCTESWGTCPFSADRAPLISSMIPSSGSDGAMVVLDWTTNKSYEFWQYNWRGGSPTTSWGGVVKDFVNGEGLASPSQNAVGSAISRLAGVVLMHEIQRGVINHALVFSSKFSAGPRPGQRDPAFRYPAKKSDGKYTGANGIEEGTRVQLDPAVNCDTLAEAGRGEKAVCRAMQKYGAYDIDVGGAPMALIFRNTSCGRAGSLSGSWHGVGPLCLYAHPLEQAARVESMEQFPVIRFLLSHLAPAEPARVQNKKS